MVYLKRDCEALDMTSETKVPADLQRALKAKSRVVALWDGLTPLARSDWIRWVESAKQLETRHRRIEQTPSKLLSGKRRPCCFAIVPMNLYKALGDNPKAKAKWKDLTSIEKRSFSSWIDSAKESTLRGVRVATVCVMIAAGKRHP